MLQNPADPKCGLDCQTAYFALVGQLMSLTAQAEQHANEILALTYGVPEEHRQRLTDELLTSMRLEKKMKWMANLSLDYFAADHVTPQFLKGNWRKVTEMRNRVGHGYYVTGTTREWAVEIVTGLSNGHRRERIELVELGRVVADAKATIHHIICVYSQMSGSIGDPMDYNDLK